MHTRFLQQVGTCCIIPTHRILLHCKKASFHIKEVLYRRFLQPGARFLGLQEWARSLVIWYNQTRLWWEDVLLLFFCFCFREWKQIQGKLQKLGHRSYLAWTSSFQSAGLKVHWSGSFQYLCVLRYLHACGIQSTSLHKASKCCRKLQPKSSGRITFNSQEGSSSSHNGSAL